MRRFSSRIWLAVASAALAAVLLIAGGLALWGSAYVHNTVQGQLASQQIMFPPAAAFAHPKAGTEITPSMIPSRQPVRGPADADRPAGRGVRRPLHRRAHPNMAGGKTYSQLSTKSLAQPNNTQLQPTSPPSSRARRCAACC